MERKYAAASAAIAVAVLLPIGRYVIASRQDAADRQASLAVERRFVSNRAAATGIAQTPTGIGQWRGRNGANGQGRRRRRGGQGGPPGQGRARRMEQMAKEVGLNPTQMQRIQAAQQSARPMMADVFRNPQLTRDQKMAAMQQVRAAQQAQINQILTPEQQTKYQAFQEKMRAQRQARWRENGGSGGAWGGPGRVGGGNTAPQTGDQN